MLKTPVLLNILFYCVPVTHITCTYYSYNIKLCINYATQFFDELHYNIIKRKTFILNCNTLQYHCICHQ